MAIRTTAAGLAAALRRMAEQAPAAVERGLVDAGLQLQGSLVQRALRETDPQPVDQGQYKGAWTKTDVPGGCIVGNASKQALFIERGRAPGPVPFKAIFAWVKRKGFARAQARHVAKAQGRRSSKSEQEQAEVTAALAIQRKIEQQGIEPKWVLRRATDALRPKLPGILRRALKELRP